MASLTQKRIIDVAPDRGYAVRFPPDPHVVDVLKFSLDAQAIWSDEHACFLFGESAAAASSMRRLAKDCGFIITQHAEARLRQTENTKPSWGVPVPNEEKLERTYVRPLFPYQEAAVLFIKRHRKVLLADDVGVGKTAEAIASIEELHAYPCIVVCPANLKEQWKEEIRAMTGPNRRIVILSGTKPKPLDPRTEFFLINYDVLHAWVPELEAIKPQAVVGDELHFAKNMKARRSKAVSFLMQGVPNRIGLTGTPYPNGDIRELATMLEHLGTVQDMGGKNRLVARHGIFSTDTSHGEKCIAIRDSDMLKANLRQSIMVQRFRREVRKDMKETIRSIRRVENANKEGYKHATELAQSYVLEHGGDALAMTVQGRNLRSELRKQAGLGKIKAATEWAEECLSAGRPVVIFTHHVDVARLVAHGLKHSTSIFTGSFSQVNGKDCTKDQAKAAFLAGETKVFVATIDSAGTGLDSLQKVAADLCFVELPWTPGQLIQAEGRLDRTGQLDVVSTTFLIALDTIDEDNMVPSLSLKSKNIEALMGSDGEPLHAILKRIRGE